MIIVLVSTCFMERIQSQCSLTKPGQSSKSRENEEGRGRTNHLSLQSRSLEDGHRRIHHLFPPRAVLGSDAVEEAEVGDVAEKIYQSIVKKMKSICRAQLL